MQSDLGFADEVRAACGWNQTRTDWKRLLDYEPQGCFCALWDGQRAGTITTTRYGTDLAWIGMMLVHPQFRRRGVSTGLMNHAIRYLRRCGVGCIKLDATPEGEPVYRSLGFQPQFGLQRWEASLAGIPKENESYVPLEAHRRLDRGAFGADRYRWLQGLAKDSREVIVSDQGFGMARAGARANYLGPVVAATPQGGEALGRALATGLSGLTFWDIPDPNGPAVALAEALGFTPTRTLLRMCLGDGAATSDPLRQFAIGEPATG